jgi:hypothetical protein
MTELAPPSLTHVSLFNHPAFSALPNDERRYVRIDIESNGRFVGTLAGVLTDGTFVSGYGASFGGIDFVRERETLEVVMQAIDDLLARLREMGVAVVCVRCKPFHYSQNEQYLHFALARAGFAIGEVNLNFFLDLERFGTPSGYRDGLRHAPERQLRLALAGDFTWREAETPTDWTTGYEVLAESRSRNGAVLSLPLSSVLAMREMFGDRVSLYMLERERECIAAALMYAVLPKHALVMYWGDREDRAVRMSAKRPPFALMNLVAFRTIETGFSRGFRTIDLGPVSTAERVNTGNARFKASIDATADFRYTLTRTL